MVVCSAFGKDEDMVDFMSTYLGEKGTSCKRIEDRAIRSSKGSDVFNAERVRLIMNVR